VKTIGFDSNVLITLKLQRQPNFSKAKSYLRECLDGKIKLFIPLPALLETEWVMRSFYKQPKEKILEYFEELLLIDNLITEKKEEIKLSLNLYKHSSKVSFTDCIIISGIQNKNYDFLTFDKDLDKLFKSIS